MWERGDKGQEPLSDVHRVRPHSPIGHTPTTLPPYDQHAITHAPHPRTRTHTHTATTTTYLTFSDVMLGQPCATDSIDLSVNFPQNLRVVRAWMGRR